MTEPMMHQDVFFFFFRKELGQQKRVYVIGKDEVEPTTVLNSSNSCVISLRFVSFVFFFSILKSFSSTMAHQKKCQEHKASKMHCQKAGIPFRPQKFIATSRGRGSRGRGRGLGHETEEVVRKSFASEAFFVG